MTNRKDFDQLWLEKLSSCLDKVAGKEIKTKIMRESEDLSSNSDRKEVIKWTNEAMKRIDELLDEQQQHDILTGCACQYPTEKLEHLRKKYTETSDIALVHRLLQEQFLVEIREYKKLNDEHFEFIKSNDMGMAGRREGNIIYATKIPKQFHEYLEATDPAEKNYYFCHCPRVRTVLKNGESTISPIYCYCGAGFYRGIWEYILKKPVRVEVIDSVFKGDQFCKIAIYLPLDTSEVKQSH